MTPLTEIQLYNTALDNTGIITTIEHCINTIAGKTGDSARLQERIERLRDTSDQETRDDLKKGLSAVTWSGTFTKRAAKNLKQYSGLICLDIDKLNETELINAKKLWVLSKYCFACFISPSGTGLKIIFKVAGTAAEHKEYFLQIEEYIFSQSQIAIDPSGKDVSRLCFLSYDPDIYFNPDSKPFQLTGPTEAQKKAATSTKKESQHIELIEGSAADVWKTTADYMQYADGQRNNFIYKYACNCNRKGITMQDAIGEATTYAADMKQSEIEITIKSAYTHNATEWAKFAKKNNTNGNTKSTTKRIGNVNTTAISNVPGNDGTANNGVTNSSHHLTDFPAFWQQIEDKKNQDENGNPLKRFNIYYTGLINFLANAGYFRMPLPNKTFEFISFSNNVCDTVPIQYMKDFLMDWCNEKQQQANQEQDTDTWKTIGGVREMMIRGAERYFNINKLSILPYKRIDFVKDTKECAYFFFRNCYVKVTKDDIETRPISELTQTIWQADIIDRDFTREKIVYPETDKGFDLDNFNCEFAKYMALVSSNPEKYHEVDKKTVIERFYSHCSAVGYMLHGWKSKIGKAIIAVDHKVPEDKSEQNGGTGKSIYGISFNYVKSSCAIDGREFKDDYPFRFERVGVDTKIVVMQDCRYNLDFGSFFVPITSDFTYNKRHTGYITLPYDDSPKWWFDTNFTFKGEGSSYRRRQHIIEFDDYFDDNYNPQDEFEHLLFQDWDATEWNKFYNHYFQCVQTFLATGLVDYPKSNYDSRRLLTETPIEFIDWLDAKEPAVNVLNEKINKYKIPRNTKLVKKELMKLWNDEAVSMNMQKFTPHYFSKCTKRYCRNKGFTLYTPKSSGVEYYILADEKYNPSHVQEGTTDLFNQTIQ